MKRFKNYLELKYILASIDLSDENRVKIRREYKDDKSTDNQKLYKYLASYAERVNSTYVEEQMHILFTMRTFFVVSMFVLGLFAGYGLLNYGVDSQINVTSFFVMLIMLPFIVTVVTFYNLITLLVFSKKKSKRTLLIHLMKFFNRTEPKLDNELFYPLVLEKAQEGSLALVIGTLLALAMTLVGKFVPFGWESTLIDSTLMQSIINIVASPWRYFLPSAVPSIEMIQDTQYFLHGVEGVAKNSGSWWKFLGMSLLVWGVIPKIVVLILAKIYFHETLYNNILNNENSKKILQYMNEEFITTTEYLYKEDTHTEHSSSETLSHRVDIVYDSIISWEYEKSQLLDIFSRLNMPSDKNLISIDEFYEDEANVIEALNGVVLIVVAGFEAPTKDILTFIDKILSHNIELIILPIGTEKYNFVAQKEDIRSWKDKIKEINSEKVQVYANQ